MTKVIQLIDSLNAGGAERLAVTYANILSKEIEGSFLCTTRQEGLLKKSINDDVGYLFLQKKSSLDLRAVFLFKKYLKTHGIEVVHAHATSYFFATLIKLISPSIKIVWHDHYGKSEDLSNRPKLILKLCSLFFSQIFSVNQKLLQWSKNNLWCKNVEYLQNIVVLDAVKAVTKLNGLEGKRVLSLANLRPQKDHINLFKAFQIVSKSHPDWTLHCVGKDFEDDYSRLIRQFVIENKLDNSIYFYGSKPDVKNIISQCEIGVLSSYSEGLPLALLEYGVGGLAVIATDVGDCGVVINSEKYGQLIEAENPNVLAKAMNHYIEGKEKMNIAAYNLKQRMKETFSQRSIVEKLKSVYEA